MFLNAGAGTCWDNVRMISQNWYPMYGSGSFNWSDSKWSATSGSGYTGSWVSGKDAVFEGTTGGTVNVSSPVTANSLNFSTDATMAGYMLSGSTITLTGDAVITTGAGTNGTSNAGGGTHTIASVLAGSAGMYKAGGGTLVLTGANNYTGGTTVGGGTLQIGGGGTTGSIAGDVVNLANLAFNRSDTYTFGGNISGTGSLTQQGSGRLILTGASSYSGVTTVQSGALQVNNASAAMNVLTNAGGANVSGGFLVLDYSASGVSVGSTVQILLKTAYNGGTSSFLTGQLRNASATSAIGLGWVDNAATKQVTVMPAMYGDANLDGTVGLADLNTLLTNYGKSGMTWSQGDFNYDGTVGLADLNTLLTYYGKSGPLQIANAPYPNLDSQALQLLAGDGIKLSGVTAVPEPSSLVMLASLLVLGGTWGLRRQRNRR